MNAIEEVLLKFVFVNYASLADVAKRAENISEDKYLYNLHLCSSWNILCLLFSAKKATFPMDEN